MQRQKFMISTRSDIAPFDKLRTGLPYVIAAMLVTGLYVAGGLTFLELQLADLAQSLTNSPASAAQTLVDRAFAQDHASQGFTPWIIVVMTVVAIFTAGAFFRRVGWRAGLAYLALFCTGLFVLSVLVQGYTPVMVDLTPMALGTALAYGIANTKRNLSHTRARRHKDMIARSLVENSLLGIITVDEAGCIQSINAAARVLFGYDDTEFIGMPFKHLFTAENDENPPEDGEDNLVQMARFTIAGRQDVNGRHKDGHVFPMELTVYELELDNQILITAFASDITSRKQQERELQHQATHDPLTGLPNRTKFANQLELEMTQAIEEDGMTAVLLLDLDRFKEVNDTLGHTIGDRLLQELAARLADHMPSRAMIARFGGDEFAFLMPSIMSVGAAAQFALSILDEVEQPFTLDGITIEVGGSIGGAISPQHGSDVSDLLQHADIAMYTAKRDQAGYALYVPENDPHSVRNLTLTGDLRRAIETDELDIAFQPKIDIRACRVVGAEVLVRWPRPEHGDVSPDEFVAHAEQCGLILPLTKWVLNAALERASEWSASGLQINIAVNLSAQLLHYAAILPTVTSLLRKWDFPARRLTLEVTENALMVNPAHAMEVIARFAELGVKISIDDFGTGYSSLSYLKTLAAAELKVDKSFVIGIDDSVSDRTIVRSVISMAHDLGLKVVAEGIETTEAFAILDGFGCDIGQGYLFGRPMNAVDFTEWMRNSDWAHASGADPDGKESKSPSSHPNVIEFNRPRT